MKNPTNSVAENFFRGSAFAILASAITALFSYLIRIILSRSLTVEDFGLFYSILALFTFFSAYTDLGFGKASVFYMARFFDEKKWLLMWKSFIYNLLISGIVTFVLFILFFILKDWLTDNYFKNEASRLVLPFFSVYLIVESLSLVIRSIFLATNKFFYYAATLPIRFSLILGGMTFLFLSHNTSIVAFTLVWILGSGISLALECIFLIVKQNTLFTFFKHDAFLLKKLKDYAFPSLAGTFIQEINAYADVFILIAVRGVATVGVFNIVYPIIMMPNLFIFPLNRLLFPIVSSLHNRSENTEKVSRIIESIYKVLPFLSLYFNVFIFLFAPSAIATLFTYRWVDLGSNPLIAMSVGFFFITFISSLSVILEGMGLVKEKIKISFFVALLNIVLSVVLGFYLGIFGIIIAASISQIILVVGYTKILSQHITFNIPYRHYTVFAVFFFVLISLVKLSGFWPQTLISFLATGFVYTILVAIFAVMSKIIDPYLLKLVFKKLPFRTE